MPKMKAECTWGEGNDVMIILNGETLVLYEPVSRLNQFKHGAVQQGSIDLTIAEATNLRDQLTIAINRAIELEQLYDDYCASQGRQE